MKNKNLIGIIIFATLFIASVGYLMDFNTPSQGDILGVSKADSLDGQTYWIVPFTQTEYTEDKIVTISEQSNINGVNSNGESVSGTINGDFKLVINEDDIGWEIGIDDRTSPIYVNNLHDYQEDDSLSSYAYGDIRLEHSLSSSGFKYYEIVDDTWSPIAEYDMSVTIDGETYTVTVDGESSDGRYYIDPDGDGGLPPIFYEEAGMLNARETNTHPDYNEDFIIIPYGDNQIFLMGTDEKDLEDMFKVPTEYNSNDWNSIMSGKTGEEREWLDVNFDGVVDKRTNLMDGSPELNEINMNFGVEEFCTEHWQFNTQYSGTTLPSPIPSTSSSMVDIVMPSNYEVTPSPNYDKLLIRDKQVLQYKSPLVVQGAWYIPIDYGVLKFDKVETKPDIIGYRILGTLYDDGSSILEVKVKNEGEAGQITLEVHKNENSGNIQIEEMVKKEYFDVDEEKIVEFVINGLDADADYEGMFTLRAQGSGIYKDEANIEYKVVDKDSIPEGDFVYITINAVDQNGEAVNFPIIVKQNNDEQTGVWQGKVVKGTIAVEGVRTYGFEPDNTEFTVTKDGQTFDFVYEYDGTGGHVGDTNWLLIGGIIFVLIILFSGLGYGTYVYTKKNKGKKQRK